jgi:hypothetical protein
MKAPRLLPMAVSDRSPLPKVDVQSQTGVQACGLDPQFVTSRMEVDLSSFCSCKVE